MGPARHLFINMLATTVVQHIRMPARLRLSHALTRNYGSSYHIPVLCEQVCEHLVWNPDGVYVDCTLGGGGHTAALLDRMKGAKGRVISIDQDAQAIQEATRRLQPEIEAGRVEIVHDNFRNLGSILAQSKTLKERGARTVDGILMDLGVSSHQLDDPGRGFSYLREGPLDMRMKHSSSTGLTAADVLNRYSEKQLQDLLSKYGEMSKARTIAREIVQSRPLETTKELADIVQRFFPHAMRHKVLSQCFQALRIEVNDEMAALSTLLMSLFQYTHEGSRLCVLSYHSLEDRQVKRLLRSGRVDDVLMKDRFGNVLSPWAALDGLKRPITASEDEQEENRRARSVKMRVGVRTKFQPNDAWIRAAFGDDD